MRWLPLAILIAACGGNEKSASTTAHNTDSIVHADSLALVKALAAPIKVDTANRTLSMAAGAQAYRVEAVAASGSINGFVHSNSALPIDTLVAPNFDSTRCKAFQDVTSPTRRGDKSGAVGNAIAWLVGVASGPADSSSRRVSLRFEKCHLEPRVQRAPVGASINVNYRIEGAADLRFFEIGAADNATRTVLHFTDPGQVVPSTIALAKPGLIEVRDAKHNWIRGFIAVAPHPFVAVTSADGKFSFSGIPVGTYQLVVWQERLGSRVSTVTVKRGVAESVRVEY